MKIAINRPTYYEITEAEAEVITKLYGLNKPGSAVKFIKNQHTLGLYEAKRICDVIAGKESQTQLNYVVR